MARQGEVRHGKHWLGQVVSGRDWQGKARYGIKQIWKVLVKIWNFPNAAGYGKPRFGGVRQCEVWLGSAWQGMVRFKKGVKICEGIFIKQI